MIIRRSRSGSTTCDGSSGQGFPEPPAIHRGLLIQMSRYRLKSRRDRSRWPTPDNPPQPERAMLGGQVDAEVHTVVRPHAVAVRSAIFNTSSSASRMRLRSMACLSGGSVRGSASTWPSIIRNAPAAVSTARAWSVAAWNEIATSNSSAAIRAYRSGPRSVSRPMAHGQSLCVSDDFRGSGGMGRLEDAISNFRG